MIYVIQSQTIEGTYALLGAEYREYDTLEEAMEKAISAWRAGNRVRIIEGLTDTVVVQFTPYGIKPTKSIPIVCAHCGEPPVPRCKCQCGADIPGDVRVI